MMVRVGDESLKKLSDSEAVREELSLKRAHIARVLEEFRVTGTMTTQQNEEAQSLPVEVQALLAKLHGNMQVVQKLLGDRLIVGADYEKYLNRKDLGVEGPLPVGIEKILTQECPVYGAEKKVFQTHILAWIPVGLSLKGLSEAVGGQAGKVLCSDWFMEDEHQAIGEAELSSGKWLLIPDKCPPSTKGKNWNDTVEALKAYPMYEQADALSFATALIMRERKSEQHERHYKEEWAWCQDRPWGASGGALFVGNFDADGLFVDLGHHAYVNSWFGAAASWNFR